MKSTFHFKSNLHVYDRDCDVHTVPESFYFPTGTVSELLTNGERTVSERKSGKVESFRDCIGKPTFIHKVIFFVLDLVGDIIG